LEVREGYVQNLSETQSKPTLQELKAMLGMQERRIQSESYAFSVLPGGLAKSGMTEVTGEGKTELVMKFLEEHPDFNVAWVESEWTVYPEAFPQHGVDLDRVLFVEAEDDFCWASLQLLRSGLFQVLVLSGDQTYSDRILRRIQIESEKAGAVTLLLRSSPSKWGRNFFKRQITCQRSGIEGAPHTTDLKERYQCAL
jgi:hypothetical protein